MRVQFSFMLIVTALIDYIIWTMDEVPYGALCWVAPLIIGIICAIIHELN